MANAGKKRAATSTSISSSSNKKLKIANKQASSKHKGKAPSARTLAASRQKSVDDYTTFSKKQGDGGVGGRRTGNNSKRNSNADGGSGDAPSTTKLLRDKKGKNTIKEFVDLPEHMKKKLSAKKQQRKRQHDDGSEDDSDEDEDSEESQESEPENPQDLGIEDMLAESDSDGDDNSGQEHDFAKRAQFLSKLDMKELARSRAHLLSEHKASKPESSKSQRHKQLPKIAQAQAEVNSDNEENVDELSEDDFANLKDSDFDSDEDDDELSVMSDAEDDVEGEISSDDGEDLDDSDLDHSDFSDDEDDLDEDEDEDVESGSSHTLSDNEDLEDKYAAIHKKKTKREEEEAKKRHSKLPVFGASQDTESEEEDEEESEGSENSDNGEGQRPLTAKEKQAAARKSRVAHNPLQESDESSDDEETKTWKAKAKAKANAPKSNPLGARFGRPAVSDLLEIEDKMERFQAAREELAVLGREIMAEPELGMNLLRRLLSFTMPVFQPNASEKKSKGIPVDFPIRSLAMLSLLAVFLDIIPGYRIRPVTDKEKAMRASQAVLQQREFEEGLVSCYRRYLETCEAEVKANSPVAPIALKCMCELLKEKSQFNFATNILEVLVKTLGRRKFDSSSELCVSSLAAILGADTTGNMSLHTVRLLARTVKARGYSVHPAALTPLLYVRFPDHGIRASQDSVDRPQRDRRNPGFNKKGKIVEGQYLNKKARKTMREKREIEKEMAEAENEMNTEEISKNSTETLKLLFALYFRILKMPITKDEHGKPPKEAERRKIEELLPAALEGLTRFSHLVNVDFFRDLLKVLKQIAAESESSRTQLLCIGTALDLLSGQGEALNIDLSDLIARLYSLIPPLTVDVTIEEKPSSFYPPTLRKTMKALSATSYSNQTSGDVFFRILAGLFLKTRMPNPQARVLAFSKRLLTASLHWPKNTTLRCLGFVRALLVKERCLETMLRSEDRRRDGVYRYEIEQEGLANTEATVWWELALLEQRHYDEEVRAEANRLSRWSKDE